MVFNRPITWYRLSDRVEAEVKSSIDPDLRHRVIMAILVPMVPRLGFGSRIYTNIRRVKKNEPGH